MRSPLVAGFTGKGAELVTGLLLITAVPVALGPADYGEFALAVTLVGIGSAVMSLGGLAMMTRFVPAAPPGERDAVARALVGRLVRSRAAQLGAVALLGTLLAVLAPSTFSPRVTALVLVALLFEVAAAILFQTVLGFGRAGLYSFRFALQNLMLAGGAIGLDAAFGEPGAVAALPLASALAFAVGAVAVIPRLSRAGSDGQVPPGALRFGALQAASGLLGYVEQRGGVVAVALLNGVRAEAGFASIAIGVALAPVYAVQQAFAAQLPDLVQALADDPTAAERIARRVAGRLEMPAVILALAGAVFADDLTRLVLGDDFASVADALVPALALLPLAPLLALGGQFAALRLRPEARLWATGAGLGVFLLVAAAAVPGTGATGATAALLAGTAVTVIGFALALPGLLTIPRAAASAAAVAAVLVTGVVA